MRIFFLTLFLLFVFGTFQSDAAQTNQMLKVPINQQKTLAKTKLAIKFVSLVEDSRCPKGVNCIWAGNAKVQIKVSNGNESKVFELNTNLEPKTASFAGYKIELTGVAPYPANNVTTDKNAYTATFSLSQKADNAETSGCGTTKTSK